MGVMEKLERILEAVTYAEEGTSETAMKLVKRPEEEGETASYSHELLRRLISDLYIMQQRRD